MAEEKKELKKKDMNKKDEKKETEVVIPVEEKQETAEGEVGAEASEAAEEPVEEVAEELEEMEIEESAKSGKEELPDFRVGDTVKVDYKIIEGDKTRIQPYQGIVIARKGIGVSKTFTVRKISVDGVGVERIFPVCSPNIEKLKVLKRGSVRRAKLYYLRDRIGKQATRIKEKH